MCVPSSNRAGFDPKRTQPRGARTHTRKKCLGIPSRLFSRPFAPFAPSRFARSKVGQCPKPTMFHVEHCGLFRRHTQFSGNFIELVEATVVDNEPAFTLLGGADLDPH